MVKCSQCFICRQWSSDVSGVLGPMKDVQLCLPCYVDVLEVRQARGVMGEPWGGPKDSKAPQARGPGNSPSPFRQLELFD